VLEDPSLVWSEEPEFIEPCLRVAAFEEFCGDVVMGTAASNIGHTNSICSELLDLTPMSSLLLPLHAFHESLGDIRGYHPSFDPYSSFDPYCA